MNKEIVHYLTVIKQFPHKLLDCQKLTDFKFISQDKYLCQVTFLYFLIVNEYASILTKDQKLSIFYRYIYLFTSHISFKASIY